MREKTRKLILSIFLAACIVALMAASLSYTLTNGRYTGGELSEDSPYDDIIDFVGATKYTVSTPEELVNAIENGYSYIEIAEDAPDPFVINNNIADVATNLVLNVNGHIVVRNSRNPLINVQKNVSVVLVYDSESIDESTPEEDMGGFYNPVGSALQASGGTLTVGQGKYESGPRSSVGSNYTLFTPNYLFTRTSRTADSYEKNADTSVQVPNITNKQDIYIQPDTTETNDYIKGDTYLIYTEEKNAYIPLEGENADKLIVNVEEKADNSVSGDEFFVPCNVASCDFYYYYPVAGTESTVGSGDQAQTVQTYAVVYGYNEVKSLAQTENETLTDANGREADNVLVWPYAAIRSEAGSAYARGGEFYTYFGTVNTYGIYSSGGIMTVGGEASVAPVFSARGQGTCIYMAADESGDETDNILTIDSGTFSSEIGDTIQMSGGEMNVKAGKFTKTGCKKATESDRLNNQTAIISLQGGTLNVDGTKSGSDVAPVYSVTMTAGGDANGGTLQNVFGIRAVGGGEISTTGVLFDIYGDYSAGVLSYNGTINLGSDTLINVKQGDNTTVLTSAGVSSEASGTQQDHPVNLKGNVTINSNGLGITARGVVNVTGEGVAVTTTRGTGIYVNKGEFNVETGASITVKSTVLSGYSWATPPKSGTTDAPNNEPNIYNGVYVQGGSLVAEGTLNVTFTGVENTGHDKYDNLNIRSFAVRVEQAASGGETKVIIASGNITNSVGGGVYVGGGTVTLGDSKNNSGGPMIETTGTSFGSENTTAGAGNWKYYVNKTGGHAVEVNGGDLSVYNGLYKADLGNGILVRGGNARIIGGIFQGNDTQDYRNNYGGNLPAGPAAYYALKLLGGSVTTFGGTFGTYTDTTDDITTTHTAGGSSAFVTGVGDQAIANIYGGSFVVSGQAGFSVYQNVALTFTPNHAEEGFSGSAIAVSAGTTAIAVENTTDRDVSVTINGGTYASKIGDDGKRDGIWYSNPYAKLFISGDTTISANAQAGIRIVHCPAVEENVKITGDDVKVTGSQYGILYGDTDTQDSEAAVPRGLVIAGGSFTGGQDGLYYGKNGNVVHGLVISGGEFTGTDRSGLYFSTNQWDEANGDGNVSITGGTFRGKPVEYSRYVAIEGQWMYWYTNGAIGAESDDYDNGVGRSIQISDIVDWGHSVDYYSNETTISLTQTINDQLTTDRNQIALNVTGCKYPKVVVR